MSPQSPFALSSPHQTLAMAREALVDDPGEAAALAWGVLEEIPQQPEALRIYGESLARSGAPAQAIPWLTAGLRADARHLFGAEEEATGQVVRIGGFRPVACPLCGDRRGGVAWAGILPAEHNQAASLDAVRVWIRCSGCSLLRVRSPPTAEALDRWAEGRAPDPCRSRAAAEHLLDRVTNLFERKPGSPPRPFRLLEVGASETPLCGIAHARGWRVTGIRDEEPAEIPGLSYRNDIPLEGEWDLVVMSAPLEDQEDLLGVLGALAECLAPEGVLALELDLRDGPGLPEYDDPGWRAPGRRIWVEQATLRLALLEIGLRTICSWPSEERAGYSLRLARRPPRIAGKTRGWG
jgi:hypothetical protein